MAFDIDQASLDRCRHSLAIFSAFVLVLAVDVQRSRADGCFLPPRDYRGAHLREPAQRAVLVHGQGRQTMVLLVDYQGQSKEFAWIVPCPTKPEIRKGDAAVFTEAVDFYYQAQLAAWRKDQRGRNEAGGASGGPARPKVVVHSSRNVGLYRVAVLSATDGGGLQTWLADNGFAAPSGIQPVLQKYVDEKWYFVAVKVRSADRQVTLPPLRFDFSTPRPVYPLRISSAGQGLARVILYLAQPATQARRNGERYADLELDFRGISETCPKLVAMRDDLEWSAMHLRQFDFSLPPQVMKWHDDKSIEPGEFAMAAGVAEAWASPIPEEAGWAGVNLHSYGQFAYRDHTELTQSQFDELAKLGSRLGERLASKIRHAVNENGEHAESACNMAALFGDTSEQTLAALLRAGERQRLANAAVNALLGINTPAAREALLTLGRSAQGQSPSAWNRYTSSLTQALGLTNETLRVEVQVQEIKRRDPNVDVSKFDVPQRKTLPKSKVLTPQERKTVPSHLVELLSKHPEAAQGDTGERARHLLVLLTGQDFAQDWMAWRKWIAEQR